MRFKISLQQGSVDPAIKLAMMSSPDEVTSEVGSAVKDMIPYLIYLRVRTSVKPDTG